LVRGHQWFEANSAFVCIGHQTMKTVPSTAEAPRYPTKFSHMEAFRISILFMQRTGIARDLSTLFQTQIINISRRFLGVACFYYPNARISDDKLVWRRFPPHFATYVPIRSSTCILYIPYLKQLVNANVGTLNIRHLWTEMSNWIVKQRSWW
jgi:hypothetical protein